MIILPWTEKEPPPLAWLRLNVPPPRCQPDSFLELQSCSQPSLIPSTKGSGPNSSAWHPGPVDPSPTPSPPYFTPHVLRQPG